MKKRLNDIDNELERGVFLALYNSPEQRTRRRRARIALGIKHTGRGLLFSWPLYMLALGASMMPWGGFWLFIILCVPALWVSGSILWKGIHEDYEHLVKGFILPDHYLREISLRGSAP